MTHDVDVVLAVLGGTLLVLGSMSRVIVRVWLSPVLLALIVGVAAGPHGLALVTVEPAAGRPVLEEVARITLAVALVGAGLQLTSRAVRVNAGPSVVTATPAILRYAGHSAFASLRRPLDPASDGDPDDDDSG